MEMYQIEVNFSTTEVSANVYRSELATPTTTYTLGEYRTKNAATRRCNEVSRYIQTQIYQLAIILSTPTPVIGRTADEMSTQIL